MARRVDSQSEHENALHVGSGRTEGRNATPRVILSEETLVQVPPPAYVPGEAGPRQGDTEGFLVSTDYSFKMPRTEAILQFVIEDCTVD